MARDRRGPWLAFDRGWCARWQWLLLLILDEPLLGRWLRWVLCICPGDVGYRGRIVRLLPHAYVVANPDGSYTADVRTHPKYAKRIYHAFRPVWWLCHWWDQCIANPLIPAWNLGFDVLTFYPDPDPETSSVDGMVWRSSVDETLATIRAAAGTGAAAGSAAEEIPRLQASTTNDQYEFLSRGIFVFDVSDLGSGATVTDADLSLHITSTRIENLGGIDPHICGASVASPTDLSTSDYATVSHTSFASIENGSLNFDAYNAFELDSNGIAAIDPEGLAQFSLQSQWDQSGTPPSWSSGQQSYLRPLMADTSGTSSDPKLDVTFTEPDPLAITTTTLPHGYVGVPYTATVEASDGVPPYTWSIIDGALPAGLSLDPDTGEIAGTPEGTGTANFEVQVEDDASETDTAELSIQIVAPLVITTETLPPPFLNVPYSATVETTGGLPPLAFSVSDGALPSGLTLDPDTGEISGTPDTEEATNFTIRVEDDATES